MERFDSQPEPEPCVVIDMAFLRMIREQRCHPSQIRTTQPVPRLYTVQSNDNLDTEHQRTYVEDYSY